MDQYVVLQFSCEFCWGYRVKINLTDYSSKEEIIKFCTNSLHNFLWSNNLQILFEKVKQINYHIHGNISITPDASGVNGYICGHEKTCVH